MIMSTNRHAGASSAVLSPSLNLKRVLFIDHLTLLRVLDAVVEGPGMPSHGKRMKLVGFAVQYDQFL